MHERVQEPPAVLLLKWQYCHQLRRSPWNITSPIFFEWGKTGLATSTYDITEINESSDKIVVKLFVPPVQCKPKTLAVAGVETAAGIGACTPGGGCC